MGFLSARYYVLVVKEHDHELRRDQQRPFVVLGWGLPIADANATTIVSLLQFSMCGELAAVS